MNQAQTFERLACLARHVRAVRIQAVTLETELMKLLAEIAEGEMKLPKPEES